MRGIVEWFGRTCAVFLALCASAAAAQQRAASNERSAQIELLREVYKELIEINTTDSSGDNTRAAQAVAARLRAAGYPAGDVQVLVPPDAPKKGNIVARLRGRGDRKPILLLGHLDVVEAKRGDWKRDPFKLTEENGTFYARGAVDDKAMASAFVANMILYKREKFVPERDIVLALTADEEKVPTDYNGVEWLLRTHRDLIDAEYALNEGGAGSFDKGGKRINNGIMAGEKVFQTYRLEVTNPGGHAARPSKDNAIYHLADGLSRLGRFDFPFHLSEVSRRYFLAMSKLESGQLASDMKAIAVDPPDPDAVTRMTAIPKYVGMLRTTCVATMLDGGHATNALPQKAGAIVNCRILPDEKVEDVYATLVRVLADEKIRVTPVNKPVLSPAPPLNPEILRAAEDATSAMWPGVPLVPYIGVATYDARFLNNAGIPTYGLSGMFLDENPGYHGLDEHIAVQSLYDGQEFLYRVVKSLSARTATQ
jgi:acetylornithine deacetylase/succinyl-diaminopimelate desuccinylase-like protein